MPNKRRPEMTVVGIIPARGGSKGVHRKNIAPCAGRPLLAYACEAALSCRRLDRVILSTDNPAIANVGRKCGVEVPFLRPLSLARDATPMVAVLQHALEWLKSQRAVPHAIVLLQPTSPLRTAGHIDEAIDLFFRSGADTLVSIVQVPHSFNPVSVLKMGKNSRVSPFLKRSPLILRRQDKPLVYARNGPAILITRPGTIRKGLLYGKRTVGYIMDRMSSMDVDDPLDLLLVEALIKKHRL